MTLLVAAGRCWSFDVLFQLLIRKANAIPTNELETFNKCDAALIASDKALRQAEKDYKSALKNYWAAFGALRNSGQLTAEALRGLRDGA